MRRLGIYIVYDVEKIIDPYVPVVLKELKKYLTYLIVVCNFSEIKRGYGELEKYADEILFRDNQGYDAGAYKDILLSLFSSGTLDNYQELLLANDTFYGPIYSFHTMFQKMEQELCDFWGITRHPGNSKGMAYSSHIQSFFLVFKEKLLHSMEFFNYWDKLEYPQDHLEAICLFELGLNQYLEQKGYLGKSYTDILKAPFEWKISENPYGMHAFELIKDMKIPILKRKTLFFDNEGFSNALQAFNYIDINSSYNVEMIKNHIRRICHYPIGNASFDYDALENFYHSHRKIYLYGNGIWGKNLGIYFKYKGWKAEGHLVTSLEGNEGCLKFSETEIQKNDGIIIAVGKSDVIKEIYEYVLKKCCREQIFLPNFREEERN